MKPGPGECYSNQRASVVATVTERWIKKKQSSSLYPGGKTSMIRSSSSLHKLYLSLHEERGREYESCTATSCSLNTAKGVCRVDIRGFVDKNISSYNKLAQEAFLNITKSL